jgi:hypothetical protein
LALLAATARSAGNLGPGGFAGGEAAVFEQSGMAMDAPPGMTPRQPRKNVMLAATVVVGTMSLPVRIRNLTDVGVMIDGEWCPRVGTAITLRRLEKSVAAKVIWNHGGRCGLSLDRPIAVDDWIAGAGSTDRGAGAGQSRVDLVQAAIRGGAIFSAEALAPAPTPAAAPPVEQAVAAELARVKRMLDAVSDELTDDIDILMRHERAIQNFDIAAMIVAELAEVMAADDREAAIGKVQMHDLRSRLSGRLTLT